MGEVNEAIQRIYAKSAITIDLLGISCIISSMFINSSIKYS